MLLAQFSRWLSLYKGLLKCNTFNIIHARYFFYAYIYTCYARGHLVGAFGRASSVERNAKLLIILIAHHAKNASTRAWLSAQHSYKMFVFSLALLPLSHTLIRTLFLAVATWSTPVPESLLLSCRMSIDASVYSFIYFNQATWPTYSSNTIKAQTDRNSRPTFK